MVKRKKSKGADDDLSEFVVDVASGDMPADTVFRAQGANPAAAALRRMGKTKGKRTGAASRQPRREVAERERIGDLGGESELLPRASSRDPLRPILVRGIAFLPRGRDEKKLRLKSASQPIDFGQRSLHPSLAAAADRAKALLDRLPPPRVQVG